MLALVGWIDALGAWLGRAVSYLVFGMIGVIMYEIVARYFFNAPTFWGQDVSGWLQVAYVFLGGAYALQKGYFVRVDMVFERFSPKTQAVIDLTLSTVLFCCFATVMIWRGWDLAVQSWDMAETSATGGWNGRVWPAKFLVPIGVALLALAWFAHLVRRVRTTFGPGDAR